jgi:arylsulfatase A-like enzyme
MSATSSLPNVVFVLVDTLRADHLPFYGYHKETAPFVASLVERGILFERAFASSSWTAPSMASIFTSRNPSAHGVVTGFIAFQRLMKENATLSLRAIPGHLATMGETLKRAGYSTFGVADNLNIGPELGFTRGFDRFETYRYEGAPAVNKKVLEWLPDIQAAAPYFLYIHYMDPHMPYHRREPWYQEEPGPKGAARGAYDSEIRFMDEHLRELAEAFAWNENTVIVFTSDHGEEFGEHGHMGHGKQLYTESIHVPLLFVLPGYGKSSIREPVRSIDILPTLSHALGIEPEETWQGRTLLPLISRGVAEDTPPIFSELLRISEQNRPALRSVIDSQLHLIEQGWESGDPERELYDLEQDFAERHNLLPAEIDRAEALAERFSELVAEAPVEGESSSEVEVHVDQDTLEQLKSLGYLN